MFLRKVVSIMCLPSSTPNCEGACTGDCAHCPAEEVLKKKQADAKADAEALQFVHQEEPECLVPLRLVTEPERVAGGGSQW